MEYREVKRDRLYVDVLGQIQEFIVRQQLRPGDKLPPERQLINEFGVSRTVVREAIRALEERGLVEVKHGRGVYVAQPSPDTASESLALFFRVNRSSLRAVHEVREILEVEIAGLAAENATKEDRDKLQEVLNHAFGVVGSLEESVAADLRFHGVLAAATQNEVLTVLLTPIAELLREVRLATTGSAGSFERSLQGHTEIVEAVISGDREQARQAMRRHLEEVNKALDERYAQDGETDPA